MINFLLKNVTAFGLCTGPLEASAQMATSRLTEGGRTAFGIVSGETFVCNLLPLSIN